MHERLKLNSEDFLKPIQSLWNGRGLCGRKSIQGPGAWTILSPLSGIGATGRAIVCATVSAGLGVWSALSAPPARGDAPESSLTGPRTAAMPTRSAPRTKPISYVTGAERKGARKTIEYVANSGGVPPFIMVDRKEITGILPGLVELAALKFGYLFISRNLGLDEERLDGLKLMRGERTQARCSGPGARAWLNADDARNLLFSKPVLTTRESLFVRADAPPLARALEDLVGVRVGTCKGFKYPMLDPFFRKGSLVRVDFTPTDNVSCERAALNALAQGQVDATTMNIHVMGFYIKKGHFKPEQFRAEHASSKPMDLMLVCARNAASRRFLERFDTQVAAARESRLMENIISRYTSLH